MVCVLMILPACRTGPPGDVIARVGGRQVRLQAFQRYVETQTGGAWASVDDDVASQLLVQFLDREVILEMARRRGLVGEERFGRGSIPSLGDLTVSLCGPPPTPSPGAVEAAMERKKAGPFPERVRARQLVFESRTAAEKALARLRAGERWEAVSRDSSLAPNAATGGGLGWIRRGVLPGPIEKVLFALPVGKPSSPVEGPGGYHVFEVLEREEEGAGSSDAVYRAVREALENELARSHQARCLKRLRREVGLVVLWDRLWFRYDGPRLEGMDEAG